MHDRPSPTDPWLGERYPALARLLAAYLHEDWRMEAETPDAAVRQFRADDGPAAAKNAGQDIERLLQDMSSESDLSTAIDTLGSYYLPALDQLSTREWLQRMASILVDAG